jgi:DNA-binding beta-propeller fold protein YncE
MSLTTFSLCSSLATSLLAVDAAAEPYPLFESGHVRPLALAPGSGLLFAVNTPDNRLEVFRAEGGSLLRAGEVVVGLEPVAIAARSAAEVYVVNHLSDSVSVVDTSDPSRPFVRETLLTGDEPRDVVLAGPRRDRVFVTAARRGQNRPGEPQLTAPGVGRADVWVYRADDLAAPPEVLTLFCDSLRGLAASPDGARVHAAAFHSGNRTTVLAPLAVNPASGPFLGDGFVSPGLPPPLASDDGVPAPATGLIVRGAGERWLDAAGRDWSARLRFNLPDRDVFIIDAASDPPRVAGSHSGAGTTLFNVAVNPADGRIYVSNLEARNHLRFEPSLRGHPVDNRITIIGGDGEVRPVDLNPHIDRGLPGGSPAERERSLALPLGMEFSSDGRRLYLAAFGSATVAVLDADTRVEARIAVAGGPSGLALDEAANRLYVMSRFAHAVSVVDLAAGREVAAVPLRHDPEPRAVREGRPYFYDARRASAHGDAACASCHLFGDLDGLAWDLGDPAGGPAPNPLVPVDVAGNRLFGSFHPMKGPMTTQSLRGLPGAGALHWRGDRSGDEPADARAAFLAFRAAFRTLLGREEPFPEADMLELREFVLRLRYPPNPVAPLDGSLTPDQAAGKELFDSDGDPRGLGGDGNPCATCHALPLGTGGLAVAVEDQDLKVPHLRNLYQKAGMFGYAVPGVRSILPLAFDPGPTPHLGDQVRGFGFTHDGSVPTLFDFFRRPGLQFGFLDETGRSAADKMRQLEAFLLAFPTGLAPAVGQQVTLAAVGLDRRLERYRLLARRAEAGDGELVAHGIHGGRARGFLYLGADGGAARFQTDREEEVVEAAALLAAVAGGELILTVTLAPPGSGRRMALDRDEDGALDGDELALGFDPADPGSRPPPRGPRLLRGDCDGDGRLDLTDAVFTLNWLFHGGRRPPCEAACDASGEGTLNVTDPIRILRFLFLGGPPPGNYPECEAAPARCPEACTG